MYVGYPGQVLYSWRLRTEGGLVASKAEEGLVASKAEEGLVASKAVEGLVASKAVEVPTARPPGERRAVGGRLGIRRDRGGRRALLLAVSWAGEEEDGAVRPGD